jgi:hypothetical protein
MMFDSAIRMYSRLAERELGWLMSLPLGLKLVPPFFEDMENVDQRLKGYHSLCPTVWLIQELDFQYMYSRNRRYLQVDGMARSSSSDIFFRFTARDIFSGLTSRPLTRKLVSLSSRARFTCVWAINRISLSLIFFSRCHCDSLVLYWR